MKSHSSTRFINFCQLKLITMFCATCGKLLHPKQTSYGKWMSCPEGHGQPRLMQEIPVITRQNRQPGVKITVASSENILAVHDFICQKCGYHKAELIEIAPFYSDEDQLLRMKCGRCGAVKKLDGKIT